MIIVDYYSRYFEVAQLSSTTSTCVITHAKSIFSRHGIPKCVKSDNGPQYSSQEYAKFAKQWGFKHVTSSPHYPQSNGLAERTVQTVKNILRKADASGADPYLSILEYRNAPVDSIASPAQMLRSRRLRSTLPCVDAQMIPKVVDQAEAVSKLRSKQLKQKYFYDRNATPLPNLKEGDVVRVQMSPQSQWTPGVVKSKSNTPRSFVIGTHNGTYRRNRRHIMRTSVLPDSVETDVQNDMPNSVMATPTTNVPNHQNPVQCVQSLWLPWTM